MSNTFQFGAVPSIKRRRSAFNLSHGVKTAISAGYLYPLDIQEVYPGDTFKIHTKAVARVTSAFLKPVMDNCFLELYHFYVPSRLTYNKWDQVFGYNPSGYWAQSSEVDVPVFDTASNKSQVVTGSVADYMGIPLTGKNDANGTFQQGYLRGVDVSVLPFRAFALIYDEWFRDQNNEQPMQISKGDLVDATERLNNSSWSSANYCGMPPHVNKFHDLFTSCLPAPQKGGAVELSVSTPERVLPVAGIPVGTDGTAKTSYGLFPSKTVLDPLAVAAGYSQAGSGTIGVDKISTSPTGWEFTEDDYYYLGDWNGSLTNKNSGSTAKGSTAFLGNLAAYDKGVSVNAITINELRYAFALQRMLEVDARTGNRMQEFLLGHFGVYAPDARLQKPEFLGGARIPINVQQVAQTSEATENSPLGNLAGYSLTNGDLRMTKGFVEHGFIITVGFIRQIHTYQQGLERFWSRKKRIDFYDPVFSGISEQPVYTRELDMYDVGGSVPDQIFGYNEAWADLRYRQNRITGQMRSATSSGNSLDLWHFADYYANAPSLNYSFINETPAYIDRTLAVPSSSQAQFILDIYQKQIAYRELPVYSTPTSLGSQF